MRQRFSSKLFIGAIVPLVLLAGCSQADDQSANDAAPMSESYESAAIEAEAAADSVALFETNDDSASSPIPNLSDVAINLPKLAYVYDFSWRLAGDDIGKLQRRHADLCDQQGPASCQIMGMSKNGEVGDEVTGELQLAVATRHARAFGALLEKEATETGAEQISANIQAEEMSKAIVDTEARLEARIALRDRLQEVLRTRKGSVGELVKAERGVAQVNEEIDQARGWLNEMKGRIAYSRVNIRYETGAIVSNDFLAPIQAAIGSVGSILGFIIAGLMLLAVILLPIGGIAWAGRAAKRRFGKVSVAPLADG
ncbi:DUF4349 domain-containing protein [Pontixanthobacter aestiaquae]|uniref:DUF4349 domain-containing protein n=1 Tax=Pontixanthobacter aestiaquae TaxID=1509367 RepID=A0A844Z6V6_9SPHN|nr:DUF4349 domain-containing protein [Pontixanthobacter aestiaquae]MDN3645945.1 DUF4349 domain-containing protein [Pontixanthobacter aestiaquae]MXO83062.1 DUF4349 domain-containing protein [Pontixanthobacter aestiaquae]